MAKIPSLFQSFGTKPGNGSNFTPAKSPGFISKAEDNAFPDIPDTVVGREWTLKFSSIWTKLKLVICCWLLVVCCSWLIVHWGIEIELEIMNH